MYMTAFRRLLSKTPALLQKKRNFNLPEYQSKILMNEYDLSVQDFRMAASVKESEQIVAAFKPSMYVIKAQVQAGGRKLGHFDNGFESGIHLTEDPNEVPLIVSKMLGNRLITKQTTSEGVLVNEVMIAEAVLLKSERYLAIVLDREANCPVVITSSFGGINIEDIAKRHPETVNKEPISLEEGLTDFKAEKISSALGFSKGSSQFKTACKQVIRLYKLFVELDCLQVEVNPLGESEDGTIVNLDAKFVFDSNAVYRQPRVAALAAESRKLEIEAAGAGSLIALEAAAEGHGLNYIGLPSGNIGCLVNGAGLAMATLDILSLFQGRAANFLDLGGRASQSDVDFALKTLISDERVRCILINIFGGIVNCAMVAEGIVGACRIQAPNLPLIVRLEGTNAIEGRRLLRDSGLNILVASDMEEAARLACRAVQ